MIQAVYIKSNGFRKNDAFLRRRFDLPKADVALCLVDLVEDNHYDGMGGWCPVVSNEVLNRVGSSCRYYVDSCLAMCVSLFRLYEKNL
jgi:hypothetical protein